MGPAVKRAPCCPLPFSTQFGRYRLHAVVALSCGVAAGAHQTLADLDRRALRVETVVSLNLVVDLVREGLGVRSGVVRIAAMLRLQRTAGAALRLETRLDNSEGIDIVDQIKSSGSIRPNMTSCYI